jgi:hypothetical protein
MLHVEQKKGGGMPGKVGRPQVEIDFKKLDTFLLWGLSGEDAAEFFGIGFSTLQRAILRKYHINFDRYKKRKMATARVEILNQFWKKIKEGNMTAIIFGLKNYCDFHDNMKVTESYGFGFKKPKSV